LGPSQAHYLTWVDFIRRGRYEEGQVSLRGRGYGRAMTRHNINLGVMEGHSGNIERALKHLRIAASAGHYKAMHNLRKSFEGGFVSRESMEATFDSVQQFVCRDEKRSTR
jgi:TPR repeat protein